MRRFEPPGRYKAHESLKSDLCWYCERLAECIDHYPPLSRQAELIFWEGWLVNSCNRCNLILRDMMHISLGARKHFIQEELRERVLIQELFLKGYSLEQLHILTGRNRGGLRVIRDEHKKRIQQQKQQFCEEQFKQADRWLAEIKENK